MAGHEPAAPRIDVGEPISDTLLGQITQWKPTGCIAFKHRNGVISEIMRIQFPMTSKMKLLLNGSDRLRGFSWTQATGILQSPGMRARNGWRSKAGGGATVINLPAAVFRVARVPPALTASRDQ
jgi:hypothetical protein